MKIHIWFFVITIFPFVSCQNWDQSNNIEKWKSEIIAIEKEFNDMAQTEGLVKAFKFYAAEDGVIKRSNKIIQGKNAIADWYTKDVEPNESLTWKPTFIDVSQSGDLAYTYGDFTFTYIDSSGVKNRTLEFFIQYGKDKKTERGDLSGIKYSYLSHRSLLFTL